MANGVDYLSISGCADTALLLMLTATQQDTRGRGEELDYCVSLSLFKYSLLTQRTSLLRHNSVMTALSRDGMITNRNELDDQITINRAVE